MRGLSQLFSAVMMLAIAISLAVVISGWVTNLSSQQSASLQNSTKSQLDCQFAHMYIKNATYYCANNCAAGTSHNLTLVVVNSGKIQLYIDKIYVQNTTGQVFSFDVARSDLSVGSVTTVVNTSTDSCNGINNTIDKVRISSPACPNTAYDSLDGSLVNFASC